jgi:subtilisin family serine protease
MWCVQAGCASSLHQIASEMPEPSWRAATCFSVLTNRASQRFLFLAAFSSLLGFLSVRAAAQNIDPAVLNHIRSRGKATLFVILKEQADTTPAAGISSWASRGASVVSRLKEVAGRTQGPILARIITAATEIKPFWIINAIKLTTGDEQFVRELAARRDVNYIKSDESWPAPQPLPGSEEPKIQSVEWGVARVRAPEVWDQFGVRGERIVVANLDTGVQFDHPALAAQYRGRQPDGSVHHNYNWYDPQHACPGPAPCDTDGHGTHTMGTIAGDDDGLNHIGVAPRAKWIAAKTCDGVCSTSALLL